MSAEHQREHHERHERQNEQLELAAREKLEHLSHRPENSPDNSEHRTAEAREKLEHLTRNESEPKPPADAEAAAPKSLLPRLDYHFNYAQTMATVQRRLTPVSRNFSKVIHTPAIEKTSEALEKTVARPSVVAGATWTALIVGGLFYFTARRFGYALSGSEMLFSFVVGAVIGLVIEAVWRSMRRR